MDGADTKAAIQQDLPTNAPDVSATGSTTLSLKEEVLRLAALGSLEYEQQRVVVAEKLQVRVTALDNEVASIRVHSNRDARAEDEVTPWPYAVDGAALLDQIELTIRRFVICHDVVAHAAALWAAMTWFMDVVQVAPIAAITAPEKRCGKTLMLSVLGRLCYRPVMASNISPASVYRLIEALAPTLLLDEADASMKDNEPLRGILNSGHTRDSAYVYRADGQDYTPRKFSTWGAKAIAGIGSLADTIMDRSVPLELRRKLPGEVVDRLRHAEAGVFADLGRKLARFADDNKVAVGAARPDIPDQLNDRAQDNWEPLLAIADVAGRQWPQRARIAAMALSGKSDSDSSAGVELLRDIKAVFERTGKSKISSADLLSALCADEEAPWATISRGSPLGPHQLAKMLREFNIKSKTVRTPGGTPKGFELAQFKDAFQRYLTLPELTATPQQTSEIKGLSVAVAESVALSLSASATVNIDRNQPCGGVADWKAVDEGVEYNL